MSSIKELKELSVLDKDNREKRFGMKKGGFLSSLLGRADERMIEIWKAFAEFPFYRVPSHEGYAFVANTLYGIVSVRASYIYFLDESGERLLLENVQLLDLPTEPARANSVDSELLSNPPLQLRVNQSYQKLNFVTHELGELLNIPLRIRGLDFMGAILCGPFDGAKFDSRTFERLEYFSFAAASALLTIRKIKQLEARERILASRSRVSQRMLGSALEVNRFVTLLLDLALSASHSDAGFVAILDRQKTTLTVRAHKNLPEGFLENMVLEPETGLFEWSSEMADVLIVRDFNFISKYHIKRILAVPLVEKDELLGVFALLDFQDHNSDREFSLTMVSTFVEQIKLILNNSRLFENFTQRYFQTLKAMSRAFDMRSPYTVAHSQRVARVAGEIAHYMKLPETKVKNIGLAGLVHDIGMCSVADGGDDYHTDYNHTLIGASMVEVLPLSSDIVDGIRSHHEWYDGWGYPQELKGEAIPLSGRILSVAEFFVEETSNKKLQKSKTWSQLQEELSLRRNKQFDPGIVDAIIGLMQEKMQRAGTNQIEACWVFKGQPEGICINCPAYKSHQPCWSHPDVLCHKHGDMSCEDCFIFNEWIERIEQLKREGKIKGKKMEYRKKEKDGYVVLSLSGEIDVSVAPELRTILNDIIEAGQKNILVDLQNVTFIDSSGLGIFVVYYKKAKELGGNIKFAGATHVVRKVIELTRLNRHFELYDSLVEGERSFR